MNLMKKIILTVIFFISSALVMFASGEPRNAEMIEAGASRIDYSFVLAIVAASLAFCSAIFSIIAFIHQRKAINHLDQRTKMMKSRIELLQSEDVTLRLSKVERQQTANTSKIDELSVQMASLSSICVEKDKPVIADSQDETVGCDDVFTPSTLYGIFILGYSGTPVDQVSENKEDDSTIRIVTTKDDEAEVHILEHLSKTQMSSLIDNALEVVDGDPKNYSNYKELTPGTMKKEDDVWRLESKIKVELT